MRIAVFILAFYLSITPALAWFQLAVAGATAVGTIVDIAGDFKKIPSKKGLAATGTAAIKYCAKNKKCKEKFGDLIEDAEWSEVDDDDYTADDGDLWCDGSVFIQASNSIGAFGKPAIYTDSFEHYCKLPSLKDALQPLPFGRNHSYDGFEEGKSAYSRPYGVCKYSYTTFYGSEVEVKHEISMNCDESKKKPKSTDSDEQKKKKKKKEKLEADLAIQIVNDLDDIEISDFLNDYSNDIDIDKYCSKNACDDIENNFAKQINEYDYDIDKINRNNCTVKNGKIVSCEYAKKKKSDDDDDEQNNTDDTKRRDDDDTTSKDKKDDEEELKCNSSEFNKKICDFIDWMQDDEYKEVKDTKPKVKDLSEDLKIKKDRIKANAKCPAPETKFLQYAGQRAEYKIDYSNFCHALIKIKPFLVGISMIIGAMIIGGRRV